MKEVFSTTNTANSTLVAMENFLFITLVIKQVTNGAIITGKFNSTFLAVLLTGLYCITYHAFHFFNGMSVNLVILFRVRFLIKFHFIVTKSAYEKFFTLLAFKHTFSNIMFTSRLKQSCCLFSNLSRFWFPK